MAPASTESTSGFRQNEILTLDQLAGFEQIERSKTQIRAVLRTGQDSLTLDLESLNTVSSDLINFLLWCQMECSRNFVTLKVRHVTAEMLRVFRFAGLNQVLTFED